MALFDNTTYNDQGDVDCVKQLFESLLFFYVYLLHPKV